MKNSDNKPLDDTQRGIPKRYRKVITNRMTIMAWRLLGHDPSTHMSFVLWRLRKDLRWSNMDIASFTGIPPRQVASSLEFMQKFIRAGLLRRIATMNIRRELDEWDKVSGEDHHRYKKKPAFKMTHTIPWHLEVIDRIKAIDVRSDKIVGGNSEEYYRKLLGYTIDEWELYREGVAGDPLIMREESEDLFEPLETEPEDDSWFLPDSDSEAVL